MGNKINRKCPVCQSIYKADITRLKYGRETTCSRICSYKFRSNKLKNGKEYQCGVCGRKFYRSPAQIKSRHKEVFCSPSCMYKLRKRICKNPYVMIKEYDRSEAMKKAWETRRINPKPYPDSAREKARTNCIKNLSKLGKISKFEIAVGKTLNILNVRCIPQIKIRNKTGRFIFTFDYFLPDNNILLECHGNFWHGGRFSWDMPTKAQIKNLSQEEIKRNFARNKGYKFIIIWEKAFKKDPIGTCLAIVR